MQIKLRAELRRDVLKGYEQLHRKLKIPFELRISNYTSRLISELYDITFMKNAQTTRVFAAYQKVLKDVKQKPLPDVNVKKLKYYNTGFNFMEMQAPVIGNTDIKAAYASVLLNDGYLSASTYNYINTLTKQERLVCIGMLAGRKNIFFFDNRGKVVDVQEKVSETANYFFYCVLRTYTIMNDVQNLLDKDFLFSWVDGIYYRDPAKGIAVSNYLAENYNLKSTYSELKDFDFSTRKEYYRLSYVKDNEKKFFHIPFPQSEERIHLYNYLINIKNKQNENV